MYFPCCCIRTEKKKTRDLSQQTKCAIHLVFFIDGEGEGVDSIFLIAEVRLTFRARAVGQITFMEKRYQY